MADENEQLLGTPFAVVPEWVLYSGVSDRAVRLYAVLQRHVNRGSGLARPAQGRLAELLRCSEDSVQRATRELEQAGAVVVYRGHGAARASNQYLLAVEDPQYRTAAAMAAAHNRTGAALAGPNTARVRPEREEVSPPTSASQTSGAADNPVAAAIAVAEEALDAMVDDVQLALVPPPVPTPAEASRAQLAAVGVRTQQLVARIVDDRAAQGQPVPRQLCGHLASTIRRLLADGVEDEGVWAGYEYMLGKGRFAPQLLPQFVVEAAMRASGHRATGTEQAPLRYGYGVTPAMVLEMTKGR